MEAMTVKRRIFLAIALALLATLTSHLGAQAVQPGIMYPTNVPPRVKKHKPKPDALPIAPPPSPAVTLPLSSLGYGAPSLTYLGRHYSLFSLDFVGEDRLLFSFRAPGLLAREATDANTNRQMKAVVLKLPDGAADTQALWTIPDRGRYVWALQDGRFLLRDRDGLKVVGADLKIELL